MADMRTQAERWFFPDQAALYIRNHVQIHLSTQLVKLRDICAQRLTKDDLKLPQEGLRKTKKGNNWNRFPSDSIRIRIYKYLLDPDTNSNSLFGVFTIRIPISILEKTEF